MAGQHPAPEQRIGCPLCGEQFSVGETTLRSLPEAQLLTDPPVQGSVEPLLQNVPTSSGSTPEPTLAEIATSQFAPGPFPRTPSNEKIVATDSTTESRLPDGNSLSEQYLAEPDAENIPNNEELSTTIAPCDPLEIINRVETGNEQNADSRNLQDPLEPLKYDGSQHKARQTPRRFRPLVTVMGIGIVLMGGLLGQYILLWIRGSEVEFIHLAQYLPDAILPPSMHTSSANPSQSTRLEYTSLAAHDQDLGASADLATDQAAGEIAKLAPPKTSGQSGTNQKITTDHASQLLKVDPQIQPATAQLASATRPKPAETRLRGAPLVEARELAEALKAADQAQSNLLSGDLSSREAVIRKGRSFITLCNLAEKLTFVDRGMPQALTQQLLAKELFRDTMRQPKTRAELARIAARWLDHPHRSSPGFFCSGQIVDLKSSGPWVQNRLTLGTPEELTAPMGAGTDQETVKANNGLPGKAREVVVVTDKRRYGLGKQVGLVGVIVDPRQLDGYLTGQSPAAPSAVVYSRFLYDLDLPRHKTGGPAGQTPKSVLWSLGLQ